MGALISCLISPGTERIDAALLVLPIPLLPSAAEGGRERERERERASERARKDKCSLH